MNSLDTNSLATIDLDDLTAEQQGALDQLSAYATKLDKAHSKTAVFQELLKNFNRNSYYLRAGLLGKQYLQNVPNFRAQTELDLELANLYEACDGDPKQLPIDTITSFIKEWLIPCFAKGGVLKVQRTNRKWPASYNVLTPEEKAQLNLTWRSLALTHIRSLPAAFAETTLMLELTQSLAERVEATNLSPQAVVAWIGKEEKTTQAAGIKDYAVAYINLCFGLYEELGEWDSLAKFFDPKGELEAEGFSEMDREISDFAALLKADGLLDEL